MFFGTVSFIPGKEAQRCSQNENIELKDESALFWRAVQTVPDNLSDALSQGLLLRF